MARRHACRAILWLCLVLLPPSAQAQQYRQSDWVIECHERKRGQTPEQYHKQLREEMKSRPEVERFVMPYMGYPVDGVCGDYEWVVQVLTKGPHPRAGAKK